MAGSPRTPRSCPCEGSCARRACGRGMPSATRVPDARAASGIPRTAGPASGSRCSCLSLVERLEVILHLPVKIAWHLLARHVLFHLLPVLAEHTHVLQARGHVASPAHEVGVHAILPPGAHLALDPDVERVRAQPLRRITLGARALALAGQRTLAFRPVALVTGISALAALALPPATPLVFTAATQALAVTALLLHGAQLVQRTLHRLHGAIALALLERFHAFVEITGVARIAFPSEALHLLEQLAQFIRGELLSFEPTSERLGLLKDHALLALREVPLEIGQAVDLLEHADPLVTLLEEGVEVRRLAGDRRVLEDRGEISRLGGAAHARTGADVALLHVGATNIVPLGRTRALLTLEAARAVLLLVLFFLPRARQARERALGQGNRRGQRKSDAESERHRHEPGLARDASRDDSLALEGLHTSHRVGHERIHQRRAIGTVRPLERGGDAVLQGVTAVRQASGFPGGKRHEKSDEGAGERAGGEAHAGPEEALPAKGVTQRERKEGTQGPAEQAPEPVELGTTHADLPGHVGDRALQNRQVGHEALLDALAEKHLFLRRAHVLRRLGDLRDEPVHVDGFGFTLEVEDDAMAQRRQRHRPQVFHADVVAPLAERAHLG